MATRRKSSRIRGMLPESLREAKVGVGTIRITVQEAEALLSKDIAGLSDPYVVVDFNDDRIHKTEHVKNSVNPVWDDTFEYTFVEPSDGSDSILVFSVKDRDRILKIIPTKPDILGFVTIKFSDVLSAKDCTIDRWFYLQKDEALDPKTKGMLLDAGPGDLGKLKVTIKFLKDFDRTRGIENAKYDLRQNNMVTLYQDAHHEDGDLPAIADGQGRPYVHGKCWEDIYDALSNAKHFIYLCGWSFYTETRLVRDKNGDGMTFGELIKMKAADGVKVCILQWNEKTSTSTKFFSSAGFMNTHDEETRMYFEGVENVKVKLAARYESLGPKTQLFFTHHQKTVVVDADAGGDMRRVVAFVGGLDITLGRFDTPRHHVMTTLDTAHKDDFYNSRPADPKWGPRQAWHDVHSRIEGPAARDVLENFLDRWRKQAQKYMRMLCDMDDVPLLSIAEEGERFVQNEDHWTVQIFRSIDAYSTHVSHLRRLSEGAKLQKYIEKDIHHAYVYLIRRATRFIYIENQYFLGSCQHWKAHQQCGCTNRIPIEIVAKIVSKIHARERFAVYVLMPLYPEGPPADGANQEILHWQFRTMEMMYGKIAQAIAEEGLDAHPRDYLNFYCLGVREPLQPDDQPPPKLSDDWNNKVMASRRFMAYIHSKMIIIDDEVVLMGSANINQRSMAGNRDTEIAAAMAQRNHMVNIETGALPRAQVYCFRKSLWAEHLGGATDAAFDEPYSLECVRRVNELAEANFKAFTGPETVPMPGHMLRYPLQVGPDGALTPDPDCPSVPDTNASIMGAANAMPDFLTT